MHWCAAEKFIDDDEVNAVHSAGQCSMVLVANIANTDDSACLSCNGGRYIADDSTTANLHVSASGCYQYSKYTANPNANYELIFVKRGNILMTTVLMET